MEMKCSCADCAALACRSRDESKYPAFCLTGQVDPERLAQAVAAYQEDELLGKIARVSAGIEGEFYGRLTRVEETIEFIQRMGFRKVGIASCVGQMNETRTFVKILRAREIDCYVVGCKIGAIDKSEIGIPDTLKLNRGCGHESMCNPILQALELAAQGTDFNIVIGLCVGHDTLFLKHSQAPTTVMIVKDRVLAHNPAAALYTANSMYSRFKKELGV